MAAHTSTDTAIESFFSKVSNYVSTAYKRLTGNDEASIRLGRNAFDMPSYPILPIEVSILASCTGPCGGLCQLDLDKDAPTHDPGDCIAGVVHWNRPQPHADGDSITLYDHKIHSSEHYGDPIADVFAVVSRPNSCILAIADGCGWGKKPRLAARCAVHGCIDHLNQKLFAMKKNATTQDVFLALFRSFHSAQKCIIDHGGTTTTLCVALVVELCEPRAGYRWGLCVVSVGDSLCYVWRNETQEVIEVTSPLADGKERNLRDAGGCLGADLGDHPDLSNLHCCFTVLADNDIIFLCSDGISDNFDPVTLCEATSESKLEMSQYDISVAFPETGSATAGLPIVTPAQRQGCATMKMAGLLQEKWRAQRSLSATDVKDTVTHFAIEATEHKRRFMENAIGEPNSLTPAEKREQDRQIALAVKNLPGKLDHATIAAYKVGREEITMRGHSPTHSYHMNTAVAIDRRRADTSSAVGNTRFYAPIAQKVKTPAPHNHPL